MVEDRERRDAAIGRTALRRSSKASTGAGAGGEGHSGAEAAGLTCGKLNQALENHRNALRIMASSPARRRPPRRLPTLPRR
jgi:hypothetical protein